jgi:gamma-glutamylcyclotransferase (GGCT)/AIG2-like uncharacterized protein YtfP
VASYFATGSDLASSHLAPALRQAPRARLDGWRLAFAGDRTGCEASPGRAVEGRVVDLEPGALEPLGPLAQALVETAEGDRPAFIRIVAGPTSPPSPLAFTGFARAYERCDLDPTPLSEALAPFRLAAPQPGHPRLFVYGTLRLGGSNAHLLANCRFLGLACTEPAFALASFGSYPALCEGGDTAVEGELYDVPAAELVALDRLEDHPNWYVRTPVVLGDGTRAETYLMAPDACAGRPRIASGVWCTSTAPAFELTPRAAGSPRAKAS